MLTQFIPNMYAQIEESQGQCRLASRNKHSADFKTDLLRVINLSLEPVSPLGTLLRKVSEDMDCLIFVSSLFPIHIFGNYSLTLV